MKRYIQPQTQATFVILAGMLCVSTTPSLKVGSNGYVGGGETSGNPADAL